MTMTFDNPRWPEFIDRLSGPEGINLRKEDGTVKWDGKGGTDKTFAEKILRDMGFSDPQIRSSFAYFEARGGFCDSEIVLNCEPTDNDNAAIAAEESDHAGH